ncbi:Uncharacterized protein FKW44_007351 [Caligus rogercresseyi]|uniref:Chitin-binding type-2 domain-containing protein n=1 Tax=Caligus rogercresseyi TaxID=217165 RepID=A0A7T8QTH3_CALRO|nr:Uncharacterized protein FKW44_007351 [Caligus rogercresseyi]
MLLRSLGFLTLCVYSLAQDNFKCPDEFEGYYPICTAVISTGSALRVNPNQTFTTENCDYIYNINCGNRTELEAPISAPNCPRLYGTFSDPEDCSAFYNCRDGAANRYSCAPGLSYDQRDRVCKWSDEVPDCRIVVEEEGGFVCPKDSGIGIFTKHAHPEDCRQYFVCISGVPREYGCPLGTVFKVGIDSADGKCSDPTEVPECSNYYGDLDFDKQELVRAGVDPEAVGLNEVSQTRTRVNRPNSKLNKKPEKSSPKAPSKKEETPKSFDRPSRLRTALPPSSRKSPKPLPLFPSLLAGPPSTAAPAPPVDPKQRLQVLPHDPRPSPSRPRPTAAPAQPTTPVSSLAGTSSPKDSFDKQPAKVKAGEDYYYYYYYYDDEEDAPASSS